MSELNSPTEGGKISMEQSSQSIAEAQEVSVPKIQSYDEIQLTAEESKSLFEDQSDVSTAEVVKNESQPEQTPTEEQPVKDAESTEEASTDSEESSSQVYKIGDEEYSPDQILEGLEALKNRESWQKSNTEKSQSLANERKTIDRVNEIIKDKDTLTELKETLGEDHPVLKALSEVPLEENKTDEPINEESIDRIAELENKLIEIESEREVTREVTELQNKHPELKDDNEAMDEIFQTAVEKGLNLNDAYVFSKATMSEDSALKKAMSKVQEIEKAKKQPEVTEPKTNRDEPEPIAKSYDELEQMLLNDKFYNLVE